MSRQNDPYELLIAYVLGDATQEQTMAVEALLKTDPDAHRTVGRFQAALTAARSDDSVDPPRALLDAARQLFVERLARQRTATPGVLETLRRVIANLVFDSRPQLAVAGLRGGAQGYQLSFECDVADVDLEVEPSGGSDRSARRVLGQVSPRGATRPEAVTLAEPGRFVPVAFAELDDHGVFTLSADAGTYDVLIALPEALVVLSNVEIR